MEDDQRRGVREEMKYKKPRMDVYSISAKCDSCGNTYNEGSPVLVDMGMCPACIFGEWRANEEALANIFAIKAKLID